MLFLGLRSVVAQMQLDFFIHLLKMNLLPFMVLKLQDMDLIRKNMQQLLPKVVQVSCIEL